MKTSPRDNALGAQMAVLLQLMRRQHQKKIDDAGFKITMEQLAVLEALFMGGEMNMTEISTVVWKQNANITRIVDKLEHMKYVLRKSAKNDRRVNIVSLTEKGKDMFESVIPIVMETNKFITSCISKKDEEKMLFDIKKIINHLL